MSLTYAQAVDDINTMFKDAIDALAPDAPTIHWDNVREQRGTNDDPFIAWMIRHATGRQDTLGGVGNRSFLRVGNAIAMIYTPTGKGLSESYSLGKTVADAFEGKSSPNGVWFRNVRIQEIGKESEFFETHVTVEFEYYETK